MSAFGTLSDRELTDLLQSGDSGAFTEIYDRYWSGLFVHARNPLRDDEEARDIVQELFTGINRLLNTTILFVRKTVSLK